MCVHNSPLASPADLRSLGWSVFDSWLLLAAVLVSSRPGVLPSTGGVVWGWRRPDTGPASLPHRDQQEVVRTHWHNNPRPQHRWGRTASDWLLFQAFQCLCLVGRQKRSSDMECFIQLLQFRMLSRKHKCSDPMTSDTPFKEAFNGQWSGF